MKPRVYIETTIPSDLTAWHSPQLVMAANQQVDVPLPAKAAADALHIAIATTVRLSPRYCDNRVDGGQSLANPNVPTIETELHTV